MYEHKEKQAEEYVIEVQYTPRFSGSGSLFDIFTVAGEKRNGSRVRIEGKHARRIKLKRGKYVTTLTGKPLTVGTKRHYNIS